MPFTNFLDPNNPTDATQGLEIDNYLRTHAAAIIERLQDVFRNAPDGQPLILRPGIIDRADLFGTGFTIPAALVGASYSRHQALHSVTGTGVAANSNTATIIAPGAFSPALPGGAFLATDIVTVQWDMAAADGAAGSLIPRLNWIGSGSSWQLQLVIQNPTASLVGFSAGIVSYARMTLLRAAA